MNPVKALSYSGFNPPNGKEIRALGKKDYFVFSEITVAGDAPKSVIRVYEFGSCKRRNPGTWPLYIAKVGHKHYPMESITEYLIAKLGISIGLKMATPGLARIKGQIRFLSKYFLHQNEELIHGADLFSGYLEDRAFVEEVEKKNQSRNVFTVQFTKDAITWAFPDNGTDIFINFLLMLLFDAWIGNNDRHFYNWGVIRHLSRNNESSFSPIYDSARGLFWNMSENQLEKYYTKQKDSLEKSHFVRNKHVSLDSYTKKSKPKIGWESKTIDDHFSLIQEIYSSNPVHFGPIFRKFISSDNLRNMQNILSGPTGSLLTVKRKVLILECLELRYKQLLSIVSK